MLGYVSYRSLLWVQISEVRLTAYGVMKRSDTDLQAPAT